MLFAAGFLSLLIWIYLVFARGGFWRIHASISAVLPNAECADTFRIAVIIPARNEADVVGRAVASLLRQQTTQSIRLGIQIFLVNDASTDATAEVARSAATAEKQNENLNVIQGTSLPVGWLGKLWAVQQGIEMASKSAPDFFLLTDADIEHAPDNLATLLAIARSGPFDMASFMVKLHCETLAERLLIPAFVYFFFKLYPPSWIASERSGVAGAAGGCILIRPEALEKAGGIAAIRHEVIDDCSLAARVKHSGGRLWLGASATTRSIRPYGSFAEIGRMISRSAFSQLRHSGLLLAFSITGMVATYLLPPALVLFGRQRTSVLLGAAAWGLMTLSYIPVLRLYRLNLIWVLALPIAAVFYVGATFHSAWKYWTGEGGEWKGRIQDPVKTQHG